MQEHAVNKDSTRRRSRTFVVVAFLMILFGIAEVVTGFTHEFLGISTSQAIASTYASATIGACYILAGFLILTLKKWAAALAIVLLGADVVGRITLVLIGFYPVNSLENAISIFAGTIIAVIFAIYVGSKWNSFR